jgi:hypothetical protein
MHIQCLWLCRDFAWQSQRNWNCNYHEHFTRNRRPTKNYFLCFTNFVGSTFPRYEPKEFLLNKHYGFTIRPRDTITSLLHQWSLLTTRHTSVTDPEHWMCMDYLYLIFPYPRLLSPNSVYKQAVVSTYSSVC